MDDFGFERRVQSEDRSASATTTAEAPAGYRIDELNVATNRGALATLSTRGAVEAFLRQVSRLTPATAKPQSTRQGRLIFAMDATSSREPSWDQACHIQSEMFEATSNLGGIDIQLAWFRGLCDFSVSRWHHKADSLLNAMLSVNCLAGRTQIRRVLSHALKETRQQRVNAVIYVGDAIEEDTAKLRQLAGELGLLGVPVFIFHEINQEEQGPEVAATFRDIARLSGGACCPFDVSSARQLGELLRAVAVFAVGGLPALEDLNRHSRPAVVASGTGAVLGMGASSLIGALCQQVSQQMGWQHRSL